MRPILNSHCPLLRFFIAFIALTLFSSCTTKDFYCHVINEENVVLNKNYNETSISLAPSDTLLLKSYDVQKGELALRPKDGGKVFIKEDKLISLDGKPMNEVMANWDKRSAYHIVFDPIYNHIEKLESFFETKYDIKPNW